MGSDKGMSAEPDEIENLEFKWGIKKGVGGKNKDVHFYESFTYDGVEYTLYDCVYMHKDSEPEPYIGKLIKIWENTDKSKKVKILWFFRPTEISEWLRDGDVLENEIFLASGAGVGLANINHLEAIAGKCNVVCISKDCRNPQPTWEELKMANYIFYRTFDVRNYTISNELDDSVGGLEIKFIFNQKRKGNASSVSKVDSDRKEDNRNALAGEFKTAKTCRNYNPVVVREEVKAKDYFVKQESSEEKVRTGHGKDFVRLDKGLKSAQDSVALDDRPSKKAKVDCTTKFSGDKNKRSVQKRIDSDANESKDLATNVNSSEEKTRSRLTKDSLRLGKGLLNTEKPDEKTTQLSDGKLPKICADEDMKTEGQAFEVDRKPDVVRWMINPLRWNCDGYEIDGCVVGCAIGTKWEDKSKWFRALPWEQRMQSAHEKGTLVLLWNVDPEYTSGEVEDILWHAFKENCTAKMVQRIAISSPHTGQVFVIFKTREAAETVIRKLENGCLMLPNGRPLVGCFGPPPNLPGKLSTLIGHLSVDKLKFQMQREMKEAVSTSHCSQPNTIEYEMAMEWCLLQSRSDTWWKKLHKQQREALRDLMANLKSK